LNEKRQPIVEQDVAMACFNAVKDNNTVGKTYELGGPHVYTQREILEIMYNIV